jgi:hypothetical protein
MMLGIPKLSSPQRLHSNWKAGALGLVSSFVVMAMPLMLALKLLMSDMSGRIMVVNLRFIFDGKLKWFSVGAGVVGVYVDGNNRRFESVETCI